MKNDLKETLANLAETICQIREHIEELEKHIRLEEGFSYREPPGLKERPKAGSKLRWPTGEESIVCDDHLFYKRGIHLWLYPEARNYSLDALQLLCAPTGEVVKPFLVGELVGIIPALQWGARRLRIIKRQSSQLLVRWDDDTEEWVDEIELRTHCTRVKD